MKVKKTGIVLVAILFVGVCVLLYPSFSQYWNARTQSRAVDNYQEILDTLSGEDCQEIFDQAAAYNAKLEQVDSPLIKKPYSEEYYKALNTGGSGIMGYITIAKIGVEVPIYHGTSDTVLNNACGHLEGTSLPVGGSGTHSVLSAHRGLPHAKLFTNLDQLEQGDTFTVTVLNRTVTYMVDQIKIIRPDQTSDLDIVTGEDYCTLLTCTPYGINSHRLLVRGTRIENAKTIMYITSNAFEIDSLVATPVVAAPILLVLLIALMVKYRDKGSKPILEKEEDQ